MGKKSKPHLHNATMFAFGHTILLVSMGAGDLMGDVNVAKGRVKLLILLTPIGLDSNDLAIKLLFNQTLKFQKVFEHLRFSVKKVNPSELAVIIDEANIVFLTKRVKRRTPNI
jgi:hypothetical protein